MGKGIINPWKKGHMRATNNYTITEDETSPTITYYERKMRLKHYKYIDKETGKKNEIYLYVRVMPSYVSNYKYWHYRIAAISSKGVVIGQFDSERNAGLAYDTAEEAKKAFLKNYKRWLENLPGVTRT